MGHIVIEDPETGTAFTAHELGLLVALVDRNIDPKRYKPGDVQSLIYKCKSMMATRKAKS